MLNDSFVTRLGFYGQFALSCCGFSDNHWSVRWAPGSLAVILLHLLPVSYMFKWGEWGSWGSRPFFLGLEGFYLVVIRDTATLSKTSGWQDSLGD